MGRNFCRNGATSDDYYAGATLDCYLQGGRLPSDDELQAIANSSSLVSSLNMAYCNWWSNREINQYRGGSVYIRSSNGTNYSFATYRERSSNSDKFICVKK